MTTVFAIDPHTVVERKGEWNTLALVVHMDNVKKGFWPNEGRNFGEIIALMHSEVAEAHEGWETIPKKHDEKCPEYLNAFVEIADCAIRLLDMLGIYDSDLDALSTDDYRALYDGRGDVRYIISQYRPMAANLKVIDGYLANALEADRKNDTEGRVENLEHAFMTCIALLEEHYQDARVIIDSKLAYNRSRPHKHGKAFG